MSGIFTPAYDQLLKRWHHFSPSTLQAYAECERVPAYDKILKLPKKRFKAQELGTKMHAQLEHLALTGQNVLEPRLRPLRHFLPATLPAPGLIPEFGLDRKRKVDGVPYDYANAPTIEGVPIEGYVDLYAAYSVTDYKTSADVKKWAKTKEQLRKNIQLGIYGRFSQEGPEADVNARHLYAQTKDEIQCKEVAVTLSVADLRETWANAEQLARGLKSLEGITTLEDVERIPQTGIAHGHCTAYGGCSFAKVCLKSPEALLRARVQMSTRNLFSADASKQTDAVRKDQTMSSLVARIKVAQAAPAPVAPPSPASPPAAQPVASAPLPTAPVAAGGDIPSSSKGDAPCYCVGCGENVGLRPKGHVVSFHEGCKNPGGKVQTSADGTRALFNPGGQFIGTLPKVFGGQIQEVTEAPAPAPVAAPVYTAPKGILPPDAPPNDKNAAPPAKRGRPRKNPEQDSKPQGPGSVAAPVAKGGETPGTSAAVESPHAPAPSPGGSSPTATAGKLKIRLFVNCIPMNEPFQHLDVYAAEKAAAVATELQTVDYRFTDQGAIRGKGGLAALVRAEPPAAGTYVALSPGYDGPLAVAIEALVPLCEYVVKGR